MAVISVSVPKVSSSFHLLIQEALQDQQLGLTQASFTLLLLPWVPEQCEILCAPFKRGISIYYSPQNLPKVCPAGLQSKTFWTF